MSQPPVAYVDRSREYYAAQRYEVPYEWAQHDDCPFTMPRCPLSAARLTVVTTAMPDSGHTREHRRLARGNLRQPPAALFTGELAWDRDATHTDDRESYFPVRQLERLVADGRLGELAPSFHCVPTLYSARHTIEQDAPAIVAACIEEAVDVALLVPL